MNSFKSYPFTLFLLRRSLLCRHNYINVSSFFIGSNRQLSRSILKVFKPKLRDVSSRAVSPILLETVQKRLAQRKQEVDLGLGPVIEESTDLLEEAIIKAISIEHIKEIIVGNYRSMSAAHISKCFQTVFNIIKYSDNGEAIGQDLLGSNEFVLVANRTVKLARHMEPSEALSSLLVVRKLGISMDTLLGQSLLQVVRFSINEYSIEELHRLTNLLLSVQRENVVKSTLIDAVMLALPCALKNRINHKEMNFYNSRSLLRCLELIVQFGNGQFADVEALNKILHYIYLNMKKLNLRESIQLLSNIYSLNVNDEECFLKSQSIASKCIEVILRADKCDLGNLPGSILVNALQKMKRNYRFYNQELFCFVSEYALHNDNFTVNDLYFILQHNWNFKFVDYNLLAYFAKLIEAKDPALLANDSRINVTNLLQFFTLPSDHNKIHSNFSLLCDIILSSPAFELEASKSRMVYFNFLKNSILLGVKLNESLVHEWLTKYLQSAFDESLSTSKKHFFLRKMAFIYQGLLLNEDRKLNKELIESKLKPFVEEYTYLLNNELTSQTNATLNELRFISTRQFEEARFVNNYILNTGLVVDLLVQTGNRSFGFVIMNRRNYCREPHILDCDSQYQLDMLQRSGISPIEVEYARWRSMSDAEKEHFIETEISFAQ